MRLNRSPFARTRPRRAASNGTELLVYEEIGFWGITADQFRRDLDAAPDGELHVRINSPGGSVFDGVAIYNALVERGDVVTHIDGLAASIASVIALAGEQRQISQGARIMIHEPWSIVLGNADDMRKEADVLDGINDDIAGIYAGVTGIEVPDLLAAMKAETWYSAQEAVDEGFATELVNVRTERVDRFDLTVFQNVPRDLREARGEPTERDIERLLRDAGVSKAAAVRAAAACVTRGDPADNSGQGDPAPSNVPEAVRELRAVISTLTRKTP